MLGVIPPSKVIGVRIWIINLPLDKVSFVIDIVHLFYGGLIVVATF